MIGYRGIIAAAVGLLAMILRMSGVYELAPDDEEMMVDGILSLITLGSLCATIYYSWRKNQRVRGLKRSLAAIEERRAGRPARVEELMGRDPGAL